MKSILAVPSPLKLTPPPSIQSSNSIVSTTCPPPSPGAVSSCADVSDVSGSSVGSGSVVISGSFVGSGVTMCDVFFAYGESPSVLPSTVHVA